MKLPAQHRNLEWCRLGLMRESTLVDARGTGIPGTGRPRKWPIRWRKWILSSRPRKRLYRKWEIAHRARTQRPRVVPSFRYLLSFPRSGNHLVRYIIESVTGYPTLGAREGFEPRHTNLWIDTPINVKVPIKMASRRAIAIKRHEMQSTDHHSAPLIAIVRRPDHAIISHVGLEFARQNSAQVVDDFAALCRSVDEWPSQTSLHWFEDFTSSDTETFREAASHLLRALGVSHFDQPLRQFIANREAHNRRAFSSLERPSRSVAIKWNNPDVREVSDELSLRLHAVSASSPTLRAVMERYFGETRSKLKSRQT